MRAADVVRRDREIHLALQQVGVGLHVARQVADVAPVAVGDVAEIGSPFSSICGKRSWLKSKTLSGSDVVEDLGVEHIDAGVDGVAEDFAPARLFEELLDAALVVGDDDAVFQRIGDMRERQRRHRLASLVDTR